MVDDVSPLHEAIARLDQGEVVVKTMEELEAMERE